MHAVRSCTAALPGAGSSFMMVTHVLERSLGTIQYTCVLLAPEA